MDDIFCILKRGKESQLFDHLNGIRGEIQFTMESEKNKKLPFLDCDIMRNTDGSLMISIHRKSTHTDKYLHYNSHHPLHVRRGVVQCLFNRAEELVTTEEDLKKEKRHLYTVFSSNGYPKPFISNSIVRRRMKDEERSDRKEDLKVFIPYVEGMSEDIRRVCRKFGITTVFKSAPTLRGSLTRVKDRLTTDMQSGVVYQVPCSCGKVYIGETVRRLGTRLAEHKDACRKCNTEKSAIAEHAWSEHHPICWGQTRVIDRAGRQDQLRLKEALHIQLEQVDGHFNRDIGTELPDCWLSLLRLMPKGPSN